MSGCITINAHFLFKTGAKPDWWLFSVSLRVRRCLPIEETVPEAGRSGGRRLLSLEGGNRGVVVEDVVVL